MRHQAAGSSSTEGAACPLLAAMACPAHHISAEDDMPEPKTYTGSCHCGNVRFEVSADLSTVNACNCSMCSRAGYLLAFVPAAQFKLLAGEDAQSDYQFNKKVIHHLFCKTCGVRSFGRGEV